MKKLLFISAIAILASCQTPTNSNTVKISGTVTNNIGDTVKFMNRDTTFITTIDTTNGHFAIEFNLDSAVDMSFFHGVESTAMYVKPGDQISLSIDTEEFDESITYTGSDESSFLAWEYMFSETADWPDFMSISDDEIDSAMNEAYRPVIQRVGRFKESSPSFYFSFMNEHQDQIDYIMHRREVMGALPKLGEDAIDFAFPDRNGKEISLSSLNGSVVYVDVWAAWCGPCKAEMPYLIELEEEYHGKKIEFLGVNVDENPDKWTAMVDDKGLQGLHVTTGGWQVQFMKDYAINGIPRFMIFDSEGKVVDLDAPRPSSDEIRPLLNSLLQ